MKTVLAIMISLSLCMGASAQRRFGGFYHAYSAPRVVVAPSFGFGYGYSSVGLGLGYGYPFFGYPYLSYPVPMYGYRGGYGYNNASSQLALKIQSITLDYKNEIKAARHNKSISRTERRTKIRNLKNEREQAIVTAQENFRNRRMNYPNRGQNNNYQNGNQNNQNNQKDDLISPSSNTNS